MKNQPHAKKGGHSTVQGFGLMCMHAAKRQGRTGQGRARQGRAVECCMYVHSTNTRLTELGPAHS